MKRLKVDQDELVVLHEDDDVLDAIMEFPTVIMKDCFRALEDDKTTGLTKIVRINTIGVIVVLSKFVKEGSEGLTLVASKSKSELMDYYNKIAAEFPEAEEQVSNISNMLNAMYNHE